MQLSYYLRSLKDNPDDILSMGRLLTNAEVQTHSGIGKVSFPGYEGSVKINELASVLLKAEGFYAYKDVTREYRAFNIYESLMCYEIWDKIEELYAKSELDRQYYWFCMHVMGFKEKKNSLLSFTEREFKAIWPDGVPECIGITKSNEELWFPSASNVRKVAFDLPYLSWKEYCMDGKREPLVDEFLDKLQNNL